MLTARFTNEGDAVANDFVVRYGTCDGTLAEFVVASLEIPVEFIEYSFLLRSPVHQHLHCGNLQLFSLVVGSFISN